jgi:hypothetical protein
MLTFGEWWNNGGYLYNENARTAEEVKEDHRKVWNAAKREDNVTEMEEYVKLTEASYQSKRAKLKKAITHWIGKFMIVKAENNRLRRMNIAITKRNSELKEYMVKQEIEKYVTVIGKQPLRLEKEGYAKVPIQC